MISLLRDVQLLVKRPEGQRIRRDEIEARAAYFGRNSKEYEQIMNGCDRMRAVRNGGRRHNGEPWINHDRSVFIILFDYLGVRDFATLLAALIHDIVEDSEGEYTIDDIRRFFGVEIAELVDAVTKPERDQYPDHTDDEFQEVVFEKVARGGIKARMVKYADRLHNMITLWGNKRKKVKKIRETVIFVTPMAAKDNILWVELEMATSYQMKRLRMQAKDITGVMT